MGAPVPGDPGDGEVNYPLLGFPRPLALFPEIRVGVTFLLT